MSGFLSDDSPLKDPVFKWVGADGTPPASAEQRAQTLADEEQQRTSHDRTIAIQRQLRLEMASGNRGYGMRSLLGGLGGGRSSLLGSG